MTNAEQARAKIAQREILQIDILRALGSVVMSGPEHLAEDERDLLEVLAYGLSTLVRGAEGRQQAQRIAWLLMATADNPGLQEESTEAAMAFLESRLSELVMEIPF